VFFPLLVFLEDLAQVVLLVLLCSGLSVVSSPRVVDAPDVSCSHGYSFALVSW
jgi:hypothetical protein